MFPCNLRAKETRESIKAVVEELMAKYHDVQEHVGVEHSYLSMPHDMSEDGVCFNTMPMLRRGVKGCRIGECGQSSIGHLIHDDSK